MISFKTADFAVGLTATLSELSLFIYGEPFGLIRFPFPPWLPLLFFQTEIITSQNIWNPDLPECYTNFGGVVKQNADGGIFL